MKTGSDPRASVFVRAAALAVALFFEVQASAGEVIKVQMKDLAFAPAAFAAHVGDTVEWVNNDFVAHTATARNGDWEVNIPPRATRRLLVKRPGTVEYFCRFHPTMKGEATITAQPAQ